MIHPEDRWPLALAGALVVLGLVLGDWAVVVSGVLFAVAALTVGPWQRRRRGR